MPLSDRVVTRLATMEIDVPFVHQRYRLCEEIGRGGMGTVYRAVDRQLERDVALKLLRDTLTPDLDERLLREARIIGRLEHPGIVPIHDVGRSQDGRAFYVMKLVHGERLDEHAARSLALDEALRLFERICDTVAFAHARGVIHRDLKPANVMVGSFGEVLVLDWGLARVRDHDEAPIASSHTATDETAHGTVLGTPGFMAPEQASGRTGDVDARTDVYGLGGILTMLTAGAGSRPLAAIAAKAKAEKPGDRYPGVAALVADIRRLASGQAVEAYAEPLLERVMRMAAPYRAAILLVGTYLLLRLLLLVAAGL